MAKLYFRYGAMGSSKTANAIMVKYNYWERGKNAILIGRKVVKVGVKFNAETRVMLEDSCISMEELDLEQVKNGAYDCLIIDEAQFLTKDQVELLVKIVDEYNVPVICYGLRTDFQGNFFEGSHWLLARADAIEEVKTICWCGRKATMVARVVDGRMEKSGDQIVIGGSDLYVSLCRRHYNEGRTGPEDGNGFPLRIDPAEAADTE